MHSSILFVNIIYLYWMHIKMDAVVEFSYLQKQIFKFELMMAWE